MEALIEQRLAEWLSSDYDAETRKELQTLVDEKNEKELFDRFFMELDFGTAGLRGIIAAGTNRMNKYIVMKATQGLANYILKADPKGKEKGVVIGYDSRIKSDEFSLSAALVLAGNGIKTYLFDTLIPTPVVSYGVLHLKAISGIVITASHNPREYNGYKVMFEDGGQIIPPHDKGIIEEVRKIEKLSQVKQIEKDTAIKQGLLNYIGREILDKYLDKVQTLILNQDIVNEVAKELCVCYSPLHGAGSVPVKDIMKRIGVTNFHVVKEQDKPDGTFPTVIKPNPEETETMTMVVNLGKKMNADLVFANDPDSDRIGVGVKNKDGEYQLLNGNQVGTIITEYYLSQLKKKNRIPENGFIVKSIVSTDIVEDIARNYGVEPVEVLTGFKWICGEATRIENTTNKKYILGFEESYGYHAGNFVKDKDGIIAATIIAEIAAYCKKNKITIIEYLDNIYKQYGIYLEKQVSVGLIGVEGMEKIKKIMKTLREKPVESILGNTLMKIRDVGNSTIKDIIYNKTTQIDLPKSDVLTFYYKNDMKITARPSGTEPKIKFYFSVKKHFSNNLSLEDQKKSASEDVENLSKDFLKLIDRIINE